MKTRFGLLIAAALLLCSCGKDNGEEQQTTQPQPVHEAIGTYSFDGNEYDIVSGSYRQTDTHYIFTFSPLSEDKKPFTTYFIVGLTKGYEGQEISTERWYHNDTYIFCYDDPVYFYSEIYPVDGVFYYDTGENEHFVIRVDITLRDGRKFKMNFDGTLSEPE